MSLRVKVTHHQTSRLWESKKCWEITEFGFINVSFPDMNGPCWKFSEQDSSLKKTASCLWLYEQKGFFKKERKWCQSINEQQRKKSVKPENERLTQTTWKLELETNEETERKVLQRKTRRAETWDLNPEVTCENKNHDSEISFLKHAKIFRIKVRLEG